MTLLTIWWGLTLLIVVIWAPVRSFNTQVYKKGALKVPACHIGRGNALLLASASSQDQSVQARRAAILAQIEEASLPLQDKEFVDKVLASWKRPMPIEYVSQPLVLVGPSGVGKGRLVKSLLKDWNKYFHKVVTHTTRKPRPNEVDGVDYHYVSEEAFDSLATERGLLEQAHVHNHRYGVSLAAWHEATEQRKIPILEIDIQGAQSIRNLAKELRIDPKYVFLSPKNMAMLRDRLTLRGTETSEEIALRIRNAKKELDTVRRCPELFDHILVNDDFDTTSKAFFRLSRDEYKWLPSPAKMQMLVRRSNKVRKLREELKALDGQN